MLLNSLAGPVERDFKETEGKFSYIRLVTLIALSTLHFSGALTPGF
jgi:hypothetical protein